MKYFLILGIEFQKYKKPATITIHVGDKFIDTFQLDRDFPRTSDVIRRLETKWYYHFDRSHWLTRPSKINWWKNEGLPTIFKVYELEDRDVDGKITIDVDNDNSDYNNGFMKNSSLIKLALTALVKKRSLEKSGKHLMDDLFTLEMELWNNRLRKSESNETAKRWPVADCFMVIRDYDLYEQSRMRDRWCWLGGSFRAEFDLVKKQNGKYLGQIRRGWNGESCRTIHPADLFIASWTELLNICDENQ